jgi:hypothetical protein
VRKAIALGRLALEPLAVVCSLAGRQRELLSLRLHELQDKVPPEALWGRLVTTLVTAAAQVRAGWER